MLSAVVVCFVLTLSVILAAVFHDTHPDKRLLDLLRRPLSPHDKAAKDAALKASILRLERECCIGPWAVGDPLQPTAMPIYQDGVIETMESVDGWATAHWNGHSYEVDMSKWTEEQKW